MSDRTGKPTPLIDAGALKGMFSHLPAPMVKRCRCAFLQGRIDMLETMGRDATKESRWLKTLEETHA